MRMQTTAAIMALAAVLVGRAVAAEPPPDAAAIIRQAAARPGDRMHFTERRSNALLTQPMAFEGYVAMQGDGTLVRVVEKPFEETATIDGERATITRDGRTRSVELSRGGRGVAYLRTLYALLRGDAAALKERFQMNVSGDRERWQLTLVPSDRALARRLSRIVVAGSHDRVDSIRTEQRNGAWQDMRLERDRP